MKHLRKPLATAAAVLFAGCGLWASGNSQQISDLLARTWATPSLAQTAGGAMATPDWRSGERGCGLPKLDLRGMRKWYYQGTWHASEWANTGSTIPWRYDHVIAGHQPVELLLDGQGAAELQAVEGTPAVESGLWEADVTLPTLRDGVVVAPLWLYNRTSKDEIDFEFAGRGGLDLSLHQWPGGQHKTRTVRTFAGQDFSNRRMCLGIKVDKPGNRIDMIVNGTVIYTWRRGTESFFVNDPLRPYLELWAANPDNSGLSQWAGRFTGFRPGESMKLLVHGYRYTPLEQAPSPGRP